MTNVRKGIASGFQTLFENRSLSAFLLRLTPLLYARWHGDKDCFARLKL